MHHARRALAAAVPAAVALTAPAAATAADVTDGKEGNGAVVVVTEPGSEPEVVAPSTGSVTSGTVETPAAGEAAPLAGQTDGQSESTTATSNQGDTTSTVKSDSGDVTVTDVTTTSTADSTPTTALTVNTVVASKTVIKLKPRARLVVRRGTSRSVARRNRRRQVTRGEVTIGAGDGAARAQDGPAVTLGDLVTADRVLVRSRSVSERGRLQTRLTLDVRNVRLKADTDGPALLTVRYARLTRDRRVRIRILLTPRNGTPVARTLVVAQGSNVLDRRLYRGIPAMRDAFRRVRRQLRAVTDHRRTLPGLRVSIGRNRVHRGRDVAAGRDQTSGRLDGVTIRFRAPRTADGAGATQFGAIKATLGSVNSAATEIAEAAVSLGTEAGSAVAGILPAVPRGAATVRDFVFRPPELDVGEQDVKLEHRAIVIRLECSADARGVLSLRPARAGRGLPRKIGSDAFTCDAGKAVVRIRVSRDLARLLRDRAPLLLTATLDEADPSGTDLDLPEQLRLVAP